MLKQASLGLQAFPRELERIADGDEQGSSSAVARARINRRLAALLDPDRREMQQAKRLIDRQPRSTCAQQPSSNLPHAMNQMLIGMQETTTLEANPQQPPSAETGRNGSRLQLRVPAAARHRLTASHGTMLATLNSLQACKASG